MFKIARDLGYEPINGEMKNSLTSVWMREQGINNPDIAWEELKSMNLNSMIWVEEYRDCIWLRMDLMEALSEHKNR